MNNTLAWKRSAAAKIGRMTKDQALSLIDKINAVPLTADNPVIRNFFGFSSQSINGDIRRMLGRKAGLIR